MKRCYLFNHVLSNGKGFAFLLDPNTFQQWIKIEKSFNSLRKAFDLLHPNRTENEEWQYMIAGSDFVQDLLAFLDILSPVVDLMLHAQALDTFPFGS